MVAPSDFGLMIDVCAEWVIGFIWPHDPAAGDICSHLAHRQFPQSGVSVLLAEQGLSPLGCISRGLRLVSLSPMSGRITRT